MRRSPAVVVLGPFGPITVILTLQEVEWVAVCRGIGRESGNKGSRAVGRVTGETQSLSKLAHARRYLILLTITDNTVDQPGDVQEQRNYR